MRRAPPGRSRSRCKPELGPKALPKICASEPAREPRVSIPTAPPAQRLHESLPPPSPRAPTSPRIERGISGRNHRTSIEPRATPSRTTTTIRRTRTFTAIHFVRIPGCAPGGCGPHRGWQQYCASFNPAAEGCLTCAADRRPARVKLPLRERGVCVVTLGAPLSVPEVPEARGFRATHDEQRWPVYGQRSATYQSPGPTRA